jgi:hypothetical protein
LELTVPNNIVERWAGYTTEGNPEHNNRWEEILPNEKLCNTYSSPNIIRKSKSIKIKRTEYVTHEEVRRDHLADERRH